MPPKSKSNLAQPEFAVELKDTWAQTFQLEYDEHSELDRNEIEVFVRNLKSLIARGANEELDIRYYQIFRMFSVMALNVLKTSNQTGNSSAARNATMVMSDLRHAICVHFENLMQNFDLNEDYNRIFLSHFNTGKLPDEWHQYVLAVREDKPDDLDAWIAKKYPDRVSYNTQTKEKIFSVILSLILLRRRLKP